MAYVIRCSVKSSDFSHKDGYLQTCIIPWNSFIYVVNNLQSNAFVFGLYTSAVSIPVKPDPGCQNGRKCTCTGHIQV